MKTQGHKAQGTRTLGKVQGTRHKAQNNVKGDSTMKQARLSRTLGKALENDYKALQGNLGTKMHRGGSPVTTRQIAKVYNRGIVDTIERAERKPKVQYLPMDYLPLDTIEGGLYLEEYNLRAIPKVMQSKYKRKPRPRYDKHAKPLIISKLEKPTFEWYLDTNFLLIPYQVESSFQHTTIKGEKTSELSQFRLAVDASVDELDKLPFTTKIALSYAYGFSAKVPTQEKDNHLQTIVCKLLSVQESRQYNEGIDGTMITGFYLNEPQCYKIAKDLTADFWRLYIRNSHYSLDEIAGVDASTDPLDDGQRKFASVLVPVLWTDLTPKQKVKMQELGYSEDTFLDFMRLNSLKAQKSKSPQRLAEERKVYNELRHYARLESQHKAEVKILQGEVVDTTEYYRQAECKADLRSITKRLSKDIRKIVQKITDKVDKDGNPKVKTTSVLSSAEYQKMLRFAKSSEGVELRQTLHDLLSVS